jgi:hypothetical protein
MLCYDNFFFTRPGQSYNTSCSKIAIDLEVASSENKLRQLYQGTMEDASNHVRDLILQVQDVLQR